MFASCNRSDNELLSSIPANTEFVAVVNLDKSLKNAGASVESDRLTLPDSLKSALVDFIGSDNVDILTDVYPQMKSKSIMVFSKDNSFITSFIISDADAFGAIADKAGYKKEEASDFTKYAGKSTILVKDNQAWLLTDAGDKAASTISKVLTEAANENFTTHNGLTQKLEASDEIGVALNSSALGVTQEDTWLYGNLKSQSNTCMATFNLMHGTGEEISLSMLQSLDNDFLRFVPGDFNFVAAMGVANAEEVTKLVQVLSQSLPFKAKSAAETILPFLSRATGTVSIATKLDSATQDDDFSMAPVIMMAKMSQQDVDASVQDILTLAQSMGASVAQSQDGLYVVKGPGMTAYVGNVDGKFAVSTVPLTDTQNNAFTPYFLNRNAGMVFNIPAGYNGWFNIPAVASANVQTEQMQIELKFPQATGPFLKTLLQAVK